MGRGPHAADTTLFAAEHGPVLRQAVDELSWLLGRGYAEPSALKLVGDRHRLRQRQRTAVRRCACADAAARDRRSRRIETDALAGGAVAVDAFNCLITVEVALGGGVVLVGRDGAYRDLASVHGSYRRVDVTAEALERLVGILREAEPGIVTWYVDRPVSNSGRMRRLIESMAPPEIPGWTVELPFDPDRILASTDAVVASSDAEVLDACGPWVDLPAAIIRTSIPGAWIVDLSGGSTAG